VNRVRRMRQLKSLDFYYGIGSRYSYLASTQIAELERDTGCRVQWRPINSHALFALRGRNPFSQSPISPQYEWPYRQQDAERWAALYGVPFQEPHGRVEFDYQLLSLAVTASNRLNKVVPFSHQLFAAMFSGDLTRIDEAECVRRAEACGIAAAGFRQMLTDQETANNLQATTEKALTQGVFGVPTCIVDGQLFWGNDRLVLLRHYLREKA
jgi:2-hydroxychromene-2-carboxylate isomerase